MEKDFDTWNEIKKKTDKEIRRLYTVREVWWTRLGLNIGTEQDGKGEWYFRPCVILRGFGSDACFIIPLTTSAHEHKLRISVGVVDGRMVRANMSQIRVVDTRRLVRKIGFLDKEMFDRLRKNIRELF